VPNPGDDISQWNWIIADALISVASEPDLGLHREPPDITNRGLPSNTVTVVFTLLNIGLIRYFAGILYA
jgi:hypothetical protein